MRLIDADELLKKAQQDEFCIEGEEYSLYYVDVADVNAAPTINPDDLRQNGRWIHLKDDVVSNRFHCSECGRAEASRYPINRRLDGACKADGHGNFYYPPKMNYCPNCGADMRGDASGKK